MQAAIDGGFNIVEFTLTTPGCLDLVADFRKKVINYTAELSCTTRIFATYHGDPNACSITCSTMARS
jgi:hypothetical protein